MCQHFYRNKPNLSRELKWNKNGKRFVGKEKDAETGLSYLGVYLSLLSITFEECAKGGMRRPKAGQGLILTGFGGINSRL